MASVASTPHGAHRWLPIGDPSRWRRLVKTVAWIAAIALIVAVLELVGVDVAGWFRHLWDSVTRLGFGYLVAGWALVSTQIALTALAWFYILRAAYPGSPLDYRQVLAAYATGVALNAFLPANVGTLVTLLMYVAIVAGASFAGMLGALTVQKLFFIATSVLSYAYLFASVRGTFHRQLKLPHDHPVLIGLIVVAGASLIVVVARVFWPRLRRQWQKAKAGGAILARPRDYLVRVVLPSLGAWLAGLGVIAVFLSGYGISVSFRSVMLVTGGNSLAGGVAVTPGGLGINQATNVAALSKSANADVANAYSLGQQLAVTGWKIVFALVLVLWAFGWSRGKALVEESYADAKLKAAEDKAARQRRRAERRHAG